MFRSGTRLLNNNAAAVNALNVFPIPDGDTGTNMLLTMQAAMIEAHQCADNNASAVAQAMARGALMGARGNSGVILSQVFRGLAQGLEENKSFNGVTMAKALVKASQAAYSAVGHPTEGTMLTVIREASEVAQATSYAGFCGLQSIMEAAVNEAKDSVVRTPDLLPVLKESGVVDAGGHGLALILEGTLLYLQGKELPEEATEPEWQSPIITSPTSGEEHVYGYCTEFLLCGNHLNLQELRGKLDHMGESLLVVGDAATARIHVHTHDPGAIISYATSLGTLHSIKIDNMEEQHQEFLSSHSEDSTPPLGNISTIAVASGEGLNKVFKSLGITHVIQGGETMNPSVQDLLQAIETVPTQEVIILPNDPDILPAANQVNNLTNKQVAVMPSRTVVQGIAALIAFNHEFDLDANLEAMAENMEAVHTGAIATAVRSMKYKDLKVKKGQIIGFADEELAVADYSIQDTLQGLLQKFNLQDSEIMTVYYGDVVDWADTEKLLDPVRSQYPDLEIEVIYGGQPHYAYLISVE